MRHLAAGIVAVLVLGTTLWGQDSDFPFAPFRMYSTRDDPNGTVRVLAVEAIAADGSQRDVTEADGAPRRAELEGRIDELRDDPSLVSEFADSYLRAAPSAVALHIVWREYHLVNGRAQPPVDRLVVSVPVEGGQ